MAQDKALYDRDKRDMLAIATWAVIALLATYIIQKQAASLPWYHYWPFLLSYVVGYWFATDRRLNTSTRSISLILMLVSAFCTIAILQLEFTVILTIIWAAVLAYFTSSQRATWITIAVVVLLFAILSWQAQQVKWIEAILYGAFHLFSVSLAAANHGEEQAKEALQNKNAQLQATQHLLSELSRQSERTRIARDLHDLVGHHLTALTIKLQVAGLACSENNKAKTQIDECHQIAKLLLNDVRDAVDTLRHHQDIDFRQSLALFINQVPRLTIHLSDDNDWQLQDSALAQTMLFCIQEAITNSLKHGKSNHFWLKITPQQQQLTIAMHDDGKVDPNFKPGNGLTGIKERTQLYQGDAKFEVIAGSLHYTLTFTLPTNEEVT